MASRFYGDRTYSSQMAKLYKMVDDPSSNSVISWSDSGDSFIVWDQLKLCRDVLPKVLNISTFSEFIDLFLLGEYGFRKVESGRLEYAADDFVKGQPDRIGKLYDRIKAREAVSEEGKELNKLMAERREERRRKFKSGQKKRKRQENHEQQGKESKGTCG